MLCATLYLRFGITYLLQWRTCVLGGRREQPSAALQCSVDGGNSMLFGHICCARCWPLVVVVAATNCARPIAAHPLRQQQNAMQKETILFHRKLLILLADCLLHFYCCLENSNITTYARLWHG